MLTKRRVTRVKQSSTSWVIYMWHILTIKWAYACSFSKRLTPYCTSHRLSSRVNSACCLVCSLCQQNWTKNRVVSMFFSATFLLICKVLYKTMARSLWALLQIMIGTVKFVWIMYASWYWCVCVCVCVCVFFVFVILFELWVLHFSVIYVLVTVFY